MRISETSLVTHHFEDAIIAVTIKFSSFYKIQHTVGYSFGSSTTSENPKKIDYVNTSQPNRCSAVWKWSSGPKDQLYYLDVAPLDFSIDSRVWHRIWRKLNVSVQFGLQLWLIGSLFVRLDTTLMTGLSVLWSSSEKSIIRRKT
jgi:hypothetical protein